MLKVIRNTFYLLVFCFFVGIIALYFYAQRLADEYNLAAELDGSLWSIPARVYARPLALYVGAEISASDLEKELTLLQYEEVDNPLRKGQYSRNKNSITYYADSFNFLNSQVPSRKMTVNFDKNYITSIFNETLLEEVDFEQLNPLQIASIYPSHKQDRILLRLQDVPPILLDTVIALEDKRFWDHIGIDLKGIARSIYVTLIAKTGKQGASTITQQFIKNHYLSSEQTLSRKLKEILMALVLERHRDKAQILEGYINEIYLGQDGSRAIHGFGLASEYYFDKKIHLLDLHEIATLVALVREPGASDPRLHPQHALQRRNFILEQMFVHELISETEMKNAQAKPLRTVDKELVRDRTRYPAFVELVQKQLSEFYSREDLTRQGLNIFTTLDPLIQEKVQNAITNGLPVLEKNNKLGKDFLQSAAVVANVDNGEISAFVGSRIPQDIGFNRALNAKRQVGSVIKPAVYLSALEYPHKYNIATRLSDAPLTGKWQPKNYDRRNHGYVTLADSLIKSYNIPTARIALELGIEDIIGTLKRLGIKSELKAYPSLSLGAVDLTPLEVTQMYETIANKGFYTPLRSIREITTTDGEKIKRFETEMLQAIYSGPHYLLVSTLQEIPKRGTASALKQKIPPEWNIAGKTGTTDNYRDSWFAGFSDNFVSVVWLGNDQNKPTKLSGGKGAMRIWMDIMKDLPNKELNLEVPEDIIFLTVDINSGLLAGENCTNIKRLPFIRDYAPVKYQYCEPAIQDWVELPDNWDSDY